MDNNQKLNKIVIQLNKVIILNKFNKIIIVNKFNKIIIIMDNKLHLN